MMTVLTVLTLMTWTGTAKLILKVCVMMVVAECSLAVYRNTSSLDYLLFELQPGAFIVMVV